MQDVWFADCSLCRGPGDALVRKQRRIWTLCSGDMRRAADECRLPEGSARAGRRERRGALTRTALRHAARLYDMPTSVLRHSIQQHPLKPFLGRSQGEAQAYLAGCDCPEYLRKAERRLAEEKERCATYLDASSEPKILRVVEAELIQKQARARAARPPACAPPARAACPSAPMAACRARARRACQQGRSALLAPAATCACGRARKPVAAGGWCVRSGAANGRAGRNGRPGRALGPRPTGPRARRAQMRALAEMDGSGLVPLLVQDQAADLARMHALFARVEGGAELLRAGMVRAAPPRAPLAPPAQTRRRGLLRQWARPAACHAFNDGMAHSGLRACRGVAGVRSATLTANTTARPDGRWAGTPGRRPAPGARG